MRDKSQEMIDRKDAITHTATTIGWSIIVQDLEKIIPYLNEQIAETSPFRVFKTLELRSQRNAFNKLYKILKTQELANVLSALRDQTGG